MVERVLSFSNETGVDIEVYAVEKNDHAVVTLRNRTVSDPSWKGVKVVHSDLRHWKPTEPLDVIVR